MNAQPAVELQDVTKEFGTGEARVEALRKLDLTIQKGEFVAVMGPSGSGKSTLLHLIGGLDMPTSGQVRVAGEDLGQLSDQQLTLLRRRQFGFIFQSFNLLEELTGEENVAMPLLIAGETSASAQERAARGLRDVNLQDRGQQFASDLSGGEQQRVAIARALIAQPLLLLADEPTGNLDTKNSDQVMQLLRQLCDDSGQTILMVTHEPRHAAMADRLIHLRDGKIVDDQLLTETRTYKEVIHDLMPD